MKLSQLVRPEELSELRNPAGGEMPEITGIAYNSQNVKPGYLFFAMKGYKTDGHQYIQNAIENGAAAVCCSVLPKEPNPDIVWLRAEDPRHLLGPVSSRFFGDPSAKLVITGVTGTNGKTSTTSMVKHIFETAGKKSGLIGTIQNEIGSKILDNKGRTTPESYDVQTLLADMVSEGCSACAMEASSHALYLDRINGTQIDYGIFTNLTQDHLDFHGTMENYFAAKKKLFDLVTKAAIVCTDSPEGKALYAELKTRTLPVYSYGFDADADFTLKDLKMNLRGSSFTIVTPKSSYRVNCPLAGDFMAENAVAASIPAWLEGVPEQTIAQALASEPNVEGRMELLKTDANFDIVIDYAHSPDALEKLLRAVRKLHDKKIVLVFGANGDRDKAKRPIMGRIAGELADKIVVTSDNPASEDPQTIIDAVAAGVAEKTDNFETVLTRPEGIYRGAELCEPGDVLILAGKGHEKQEILKTETLYYNEWDTAREAVRRLGDGEASCD